MRAAPRSRRRLADASSPVDLLVNNAGFGTNRRFAVNDVAEEERQLDLLVRAVLRLTHAVVPGMVQRGHGGIVNISSLSGWLPGGTYSAAKSWVTTFTQGLARELAGTGVRAVVVCPGFTRTEFHQRGGMDVSAIPDRLWLTPEQVAREGLADLRRGRSVSVPTRTYKVLGLGARHAPRKLATDLYARSRPKK